VVLTPPAAHRRRSRPRTSAARRCRRNRRADADTAQCRHRADADTGRAPLGAMTAPAPRPPPPIPALLLLRRPSRSPLQQVGQLQHFVKSK
jgi:hypothetical protein